MKNENNLESENSIDQSLSSFLMGIKKIDRIVIVDDVRTLTDEDMDAIWKEVDEDKMKSENSKDASEE